ncbi:MAG: hypothetical protein ACM3UZ_02465 [Acidobacteriota bacterium]
MQTNNKEEILKEYTRRQRLNFIASFAVIPVALAALFELPKFRDQLPFLTDSVIKIIAFSIVIFLPIGFSTKMWRCPACNAFLGFKFSIPTCPKCSADFRKQ